MTDSLNPAAIAYLPWTRQGLAAQWSALGATTKAGRLELPVKLTLTQSGGQNRSLDVNTPVLRLHGPVDVAGIDGKQVIRTEPVDLTTGFEPNYFPAIEFDRPDLPWLFSPTTPDAQNRCQPWITLIVVPKSLAQITPAGSNTLASITCPRAELPAIGEAWAWAHVQVSSGNRTAAIKDLLADAPRGLSRLICSRRLEPDTGYVACVVPTYELGRLAGLETKLLADKLTSVHLAPAWSNEAPDTSIVLPIYYQWSFSTGINGDFEALASRLAPHQLAGDVGTLPIDVSQPGWGIETANGGTLPLRGALVARDSSSPGWAQDTELSRELAAVLNAPHQIVDGLIGPPLYGQGYARLDSLDPTAIGAPPPVWLSKLNLQVEHRIAAGLGALTVRIEQDAMMSAAWDQLAEFERSNQKARRKQLAEEVGISLTRRQGGETQSPSVTMPLPTSLPGPAFISRLARAGTAISKQTIFQPSKPKASLALVASATIAVAVSESPANAVEEPVSPSSTATELQTFTPRFQTPAGELLKDFFPTFLFPGMESLPADSVTVLTPNAAFIEAFMVGLNHEFGREMLWRGFPADARGTSFQYFWPPVSGTGNVAALQAAVDVAQAAVVAHDQNQPEPFIERPDGRQISNPAYRSWLAARESLKAALAQAASNLAQAQMPPADISPIGTWSPTSELGANGTVSQPPERLVILIKGELLKRYPRAAVYARRAKWEVNDRVLDGEIKAPLFQMDHLPDVTLLAFDLSLEAFCGTDSPAGDPGWFFVLQELPGEPRFGLDAIPDDFTGPYGASPANNWSELSWSHAAPSEEALKQLRYLTLAALPQQALPLSAGNGAPTASWARSSTDMAVITQQRPFRLAIHGASWLSASTT